jgi:glycine/serine hydroxymethyltransferase
MPLIDKAVFPGLQGGPHNNITAAKALVFYLDKKADFKKYSKDILKKYDTPLLLQEKESLIGEDEKNFVRFLSSV